MLIQVIRPVPQTCVDFVKAHEGCRLDAYLDSASVATVGYGHTGVGVHMGLSVTQDQADDYLRLDLATAAQRLEDAVGESCVTEMTDNQYAAMLSFVFNVGINPKWMIVRVLKAKRYDVVPSEMMRFVNAGGRKLQGLVNRRADEVKLWSTDEPGSVPETPSSAVTRQIDTPPTRGMVKPLGKSKSFIGSIVTGALAMLTPLVGQAQSGLKSINDAIEPYVGKSDLLRHAQQTMITALAVSAVVSVVLLWLKNRRDQNQ